MNLQTKNLVEDAKRQNAIKTLKNLGVLVPFDENFVVFHGRANTSGQPFVVERFFDNSRNKTGNQNLNSIPGLHTTTQKSIALKYAKIRADKFNEPILEKPVLKAKTEVHKIVPLKSNLLIFQFQKFYNKEDLDFGFLESYVGIDEKERQKILDYALSKQELALAQNAIKELFDGKTLEDFLPTIKNNPLAQKMLLGLQQICTENELAGKRPIIYDEDIESFVENNCFGLKRLEKMAESLAKSQNGFSILANEGDLKFLLGKFQTGIDFDQDCSFDFKVLKKFLNQEHIVGVSQKLWISSVVDEKNFDECFFFNTKDLSSKQENELEPKPTFPDVF